MGSVLRARRLAAGAILLLGTGCGDPALWERYRSESALWRAERLMERIEREPRNAALSGRAAAAFGLIVERLPPEPAPPSGYRSDLMAISGRAAQALARLDRLAGRNREAAERYGRVRRDYRGVPAVALAAATGRAEALEADGQEEAAAAELLAIGREFPAVDPGRRVALEPVLDAPRRAAALAGVAGNPAMADRAWREAVVRYRMAIPHWASTPAAPELWLRLAEAEAGLGRLDASLAALRGVLNEPRAGAARGVALVSLGERSLSGGRPDSALVYAAWAEHDLADLGRGRAMLLSAKAWESLGAADSALSAYQRFLDGFPQLTDSVVTVRMRRAELLERSGRWEESRTELRALAAGFPSHPLGFAALVRIVQHHARHGERELAAFEARRGLETIDRVITGHHEAAVQVAGRSARAELLLALDSPRAAFTTLVEVWRTYPTAPHAPEAGLRAAGIAEVRLHDAGAAVDLYRQLAAQRTDPQVRRQAQSGLARLGRVQG